MDLFDTLKTLSEISAPSGYTSAIAQCASELLNVWCDEVSKDRFNNVIGVRRSGKRNAQRIMLDAHLDEIGFIVTGHEDGFLKFAPIGGVDARMLHGRELQFLTDPVQRGIVCIKPVHVLSQSEREQGTAIEDLRIDVGFTQEEAIRKFPVGTTAVYCEKCTHLIGSRVTGKAMDDRACFVMLLRTLELLKNSELNIDVYVVGSNLEETSGEGAAAAAYAIAPNYAIACDVTFGIQPDCAEDKAFSLGSGPCIGVGPNMARWMTHKMIGIAKEMGLAYNLEVMSGNTGTNGWEIQISREGIPTQVYSIPERYMHTPVEVVDLEDIENGAQLLAEFILRLSEENAIC